MRILVRLLVGLTGLLIAAVVFRTNLAARAFNHAVSQNVGRDITDELPDGLHVLMCGAGTLDRLFMKEARSLYRGRMSVTRDGRLYSLPAGSEAVIETTAWR